jgi:hypothetical protein
LSNFNGTEIEIWAGFGLVGNTEKKFGAHYVQLFFDAFRSKKNRIFVKIL